MKTIGLVVKYDNKTIREKLAELHAWAESKKIKIIFSDGSARVTEGSEIFPTSKLGDEADLIITMGGDGTLISVARHAAESKTIILGVNFGKLGFLTEVKPEELIDTLNDLMSGQAVLSERAMISGKVKREDKEVFTCRALNDVTILRAGDSPLAEVEIYKDQELMLRLRSDGLIFSTPTGSTAYSLAAGGSIAYPGLAVLLLTAICPHSLTNRPLILPLDSTYKIKIPEQDAKLSLTMDGQESIKLKAFDSIEVARANATLQFVRSSKRSYFDILREKLNWALE